MRPSEPITIALLADIHGNRAALDAVLDDLAQVHYDQIVLMGDLVMNGPHPAESLARLMALDARGVLGNTDQAVLRGDDPVAAWARERLDPAGLAYLAALPLAQRMTPPGGTSSDSDLLVVHSTPRSCEDLLILALNHVGTDFDATTPAAEAEAMLAGARANLIVYGHIHYVSEAVVAGQRVMSVGAVGFPFDGDPAAAYALAHWTGYRWQVEHRRVPYDHESAAAAIEESSLPFAAVLARRIRTAKWIRRPDSS